MLVKVVNDNKHPYREKFRGKEIYIEAGGAVEMDINEAHIFLGTMPPNIEIDANGIQKETSYKMLRLVKPSDAKPVESAKTFTCMMDGKVFPTQKALDEHIAENYAEDIIDEDAREKVVAKQKGKKAKG